MLILAFDGRQELNALEALLKDILGDQLQFRGFQRIDELLLAAKKDGYDVVFADLEYQNRSGVLLLGELSISRPRSNFVGAAANQSETDALRMHHLHGGYIIKPYNRENLADTLSHLRCPVK